MRCPWLRLPWMRSQGTPCLTRKSASRLARCLVRVKTSTLRMSPRLRSSSRSGAFRFCGHGIDRLRDADGGRRPLEVDRDRVVQHLARERHDRRRHRRREEERLTLRRKVLQHAADVGKESHVEHAVGLVEDQDLEPVELRVGEAEVVEEPARRGDDDVDAPCGRRAPAGPCRRRRRRRPRRAGCARRGRSGAPRSAPRARASE